MPVSSYVLLFYGLITLFTLLHIFINVDDTPKALAYAMLVIALPFVGAIIYFSIGVNMRRNKLYFEKFSDATENAPEIVREFMSRADQVMELRSDELDYFLPLAKVARNENQSTSNNQCTLLINGENKFPEVLEALRAAQHHIHIEYYIFDQDKIGTEIKDILVQKAKEGVEVRFIYDDFGSSKMNKQFVQEIIDAGGEAVSFYPITLFKFGSRMNYRNHRKIIIVDGDLGFVGGINVSDKYINAEENKNDFFWRDTHVMIHGMAVNNLQYIFLRDWNFCSGQDIPFSLDYFPLHKQEGDYGTQFVQIVASGPDSDYANIMYTLIQAILTSQKEVLLTTPYFIPDRSFLDALKIAKLSGTDVKILVPGVSDSAIVNAASNSYYQELLEMGIEIYKYQKGFVHAKTMVCDGQVSFVGTANMDHRSFELNFEVNALIYDKPFAQQLRDQFFLDLRDAQQIELESWEGRSKMKKLGDKLARLMSPLM